MFFWGDCSSTSSLAHRVAEGISQARLGLERCSIFREEVDTIQVPRLSPGFFTISPKFFC